MPGRSALIQAEKTPHAPLRVATFFTIAEPPVAQGAQEIRKEFLPEWNSFVSVPMRARKSS